MLLELLKSNKQVIGTIFMNQYEWLDDFKKQDNIELIEITVENRNTLPLQIVEMVTKDNEEMQKKIKKAKRYSNEKERFISQNGNIEVHSEHGIRTVNVKEAGYTCNCDYYKDNGTCSHITAILNLNIQP